MRRYSYRRNPILPCGAATPRFDNVQIAFNVFPADAPEKRSLNHPPGTMPDYISYEDTDYEYALNKVSDANGGGTEIALLVPGQPRKEFYPREPRSPLDGPVVGGKLVVVQTDTTRIEELRNSVVGNSPGEEAFGRRRDDQVRFSCQRQQHQWLHGVVRDRSVSRTNPLSFHPQWVEHWADELEFSFQQ